MNAGIPTRPPRDLAETEAAILASIADADDPTSAPIGDYRPLPETCDLSVYLSAETGGQVTRCMPLHRARRLARAIAQTPSPLQYRATLRPVAYYLELEWRMPDGTWSGSATIVANESEWDASQSRVRRIREYAATQPPEGRPNLPADYREYLARTRKRRGADRAPSTQAPLFPEEVSA